MSLQADLVVDRLRLKRRLLVWRVLAVLLLLFLLLLAGRQNGGGGVGSGGLGGAPHVARLRVDGIITDDRKRLDLVADAAADPSVKALILCIDSPGGSVAGGERLHDAVARFAARKPVVVAMGGTAASAGYMIAVPASRIFASEATLTGSIGVILQSPDVSGLLGKVGIGVDELVSGPLKGQPSVVQPLSPAGRAMLQDIVSDLFDQFVSIVATGRHIDPARVRALADGRPYTGRQALKLGLVDAIGDERDARDWLRQAKHLAPDLPVRTLAPRPDGSWARRHLMGAAGSLGGAFLRGAIDALPNGVGEKILTGQGVVLDGAVALWQP
ncbi:MAG: signal peptide peptidase SppA [Gluconacetobacter diazotrophicus]|nr:signal peptide peptidase SppA [Gluconacetobacter diazotrophicus]